MEEKENYYSTGKVRHKKVVPTKTFGNSLLVIIVLVIVAVAAFFSGVVYEKSGTKKTSTTARDSVVGTFGRYNSVHNGQRPIFGPVTAVSATSISVQNERSGTTATLVITSSTVITNNGSTVSASSISVGDTVIVRASTTNTNQASTITVNPNFGSGTGGDSSSSTAPPSSTDGVSAD